MRVVIIGAGVTGLATAWKLAKDHEVVLLEKRPTIGGIAITVKHKDFKLDSGPHKIYSLIPGILEEMKALLGPESSQIPKSSSVIIEGRRLDFPIRFFDLLLKLPPTLSIRLGFDYGIAFLKSLVVRKKPVTYADYFKKNFGSTAYEHVFRPMAEKSFGDPNKLDAEFAARRVPYNGVFKMLKSMFFKDKSLSAEHFYYPKSGFVEMSNIMLRKAQEHGAKIVYGAQVEHFENDGSKITNVIFTQEGHKKKIAADFVVSTARLTDLPLMLNAPPEVVSSASHLKWRSILLVYVHVPRPQIMKDNWVFVPDSRFIFQRVSEQKNFSKSMGPENESVLITEVMCSFDDERWRMPAEELYEKVIADLRKAGFIAENEGTGYYVLRLKDIYPVYDVGFRERLDKVLSYADQYENFITLGRLGLFNYNNTDHCVDMAIWAANHIRARKPIADWIATRKRFDEYVIVD